MSFGFGASDFVTVCELAKKVRKEFADAPSQFKAVRDEVRSLSHILEDVDVVLSGLVPDSQEKKNLQDITTICRNVLEELEKISAKYRDLESKPEGAPEKVRRVWKRLQWEPEDVRDLRSRICSNTFLLEALFGRIVRGNTSKLVQAQDNHENRMVLEWLTPVDFAVQQYDIISRRQEGTGIWFTDSPEFHSWVRGENQTLFCPGIPGAGKSMIAAIAIDHIWKRVQNQPVGLAFIYCNYRSQADQTATSLASAVLKQLIQGHLSIPEPVTNLYKRHAERRTRPSFAEIRDAIPIVVSNYSKVYVIIDALDECLKDHRMQLLSMLRSLQSNGNLNLMATSRFVPEVEKHFSRSPLLEVRANDLDVKQFVAGQMSRLPTCVQRDVELQETIQNGISMTVEGMFLLARLHLDSLLDKNTKKKILSTLAKLPRGSEALDEAYNDAIRRIEGQLPGNFTLAKSVLSWITYAERPLTTRELCHALAVEVGESELDPDNIPDVQDMVSVCAGLVAVDEESNIIRFVHYTTQEYFERIRETWNPRAQQDIASTCLTYLSFDPFRSGSSSNNKELKRRLVENVFLDYAARNWGWHARTVQEQVYDLALHFLQDDDLVSCAAQIMFVPEYKYKVRRGYSQRFIKQVTGLHLLVEFGLLYLLQKLLSEKSTKINVVVDSKDNHGRTALTWAATKGHEAVVRLLLARDDVAADSKSNDGQTPLMWAAANGHEAVVQLLLLRGDVTVDSKDNYGRTPLSWAAGEGREGVVRLLLPRDDVAADSKDSNGWTPLMWAAKQGHEDVVRLLLALDDVAADSKSNDGQTPLSLAAEGGNQGVVQLLLARDDVEINSEDDMGWTSLSYALKGGHETVVQLLLARDDVTADSKDVSGRRPLYSAMAAWSDDEATIFDDEGDGSHTDTYESSNIIENRNLEERSRERQVSTQSEVNPALLGFERLTEKLFKTPPSLDPIHTGIGPPPNAYPATLTELGTPMWIIKKAKLFCTHFSDFVLLDKSQDSENSFTNSMKNAVERYLGATVVWWPLSTVRKQVKPHKNRISWMCCCGAQLNFWVETQHFSKVQKMLTDSLTQAAHGGTPILPTHRLPTSSRASGTSQHSASASGTSAGSAVPSESQGNTPQNGRRADISNGHVSPDLDPLPKYLHWCVMAYNTTTKLVEIETKSLTERTLVPRLLAAYFAIRGMSSWLTFTSCVGVRFVKFRKLALEEDFVVRLKDELPCRKTNKEYQYQYCDDPETPEEDFIKWLQAVIEVRIAYPNCPKTLALCSALEHIPKKVNGKMKTLEGYGVQAISAYCLWKALLALAVASVGPLVFMIRWLVGHEGDWQNALGLLAVTYSLLNIVVLQHDRWSVEKAKSQGG